MTTTNKHERARLLLRLLGGSVPGEPLTLESVERTGGAMGTAHARGWVEDDPKHAFRITPDGEAELQKRLRDAKLDEATAAALLKKPNI